MNGYKWTSTVLLKSTNNDSNYSILICFLKISSASTLAGIKMRRGVSAGGGQSSLGYLFGSDEASKPAANDSKPALNDDQSVSKESPAKPEAIQSVDVSKQIPAGIQSSAANNHFRADGQNNYNYILDRPSTKVHAAPGGGSSLGYLFGDGAD